MEEIDVKPQPESKADPRDPPDLRPIEELRFGSEWKPTLGDLQAAQPGFGTKDAPMGRRLGDWAEDEVIAKWKETHAVGLKLMVVVLKACGCVTAQDIKRLGCTGVVAHESAILQAVAASGLSTGPIFEACAFIRIGLGGTGVGLPCFVPPTRFCNRHETIGGLQAQQQAYYTSMTDGISRPLTPQEEGSVHFTEAARRTRGKDRIADTLDVLGGFKLPSGMEIVGPGEPEDNTDEEEHVFQRALRTRPWVCPEHDKLVWRCRYCIAQAIVEGELEPQFIVDSIGGPISTMVTPAEIEEELERLNNEKADHIEVSARVMTMKRKLSRT